MQQFLSNVAASGSRIAWIVAGWAASGVALAQSQEPVGAPQPPTPSRPDDPPAIMSFLLMILMIAAVVFANAIPTKRGHQD